MDKVSSSRQVQYLILTNLVRAPLSKNSVNSYIQGLIEACYLFPGHEALKNETKKPAYKPSPYNRNQERYWI